MTVDYLSPDPTSRESGCPHKRGQLRRRYFPQPRRCYPASRRRTVGATRRVDPTKTVHVTSCSSRNTKNNKPNFYRCRAGKERNSLTIDPHTQPQPIEDTLDRIASMLNALPMIIDQIALQPNDTHPILALNNALQPFMPEIEDPLGHLMNISAQCYQEVITYLHD